MSLFKNGVGRPSNETLKKRKTAYAAIAIGAVALLGIGGYLAYNFTRGDMTTSTKNITTSTSSPTVTVSAYKKGEDGKKTGKALKTTTNANLEFTDWANHQYAIVVEAKASSGTIKSITWKISSSQKATYKDANTEQSWKDGASTTYTFNQASVTKSVGANADGVRLGKITVTDSNGNSRTVKVRVNIDRTAPKLTFKITGTKSGSVYVPGAKLTATCTDKLNGVTYMKTYDTQYTSDVVTYNGKATTTKTQSISLVSAGNSRSITTTCKDALGNSTDAKKSSSYKIGYYGNSSSNSSSNSNTSSNIINATVKSWDCPSGYDKQNGGKCRKVVSGVYEYSCPSGYSKVGDGPSAYCQYKTPAARPKSYVCNSPFKAVGSTCRYETAAVRKCPSGYTYKSSEGKCTTSYGARVNPTYSCSLDYYNGTRGNVSGSKCVYSYAASVKYGAYNCNKIGGKLQGSYCVTTKATTKTRTYTYANPSNITYSCPSGYTLKGTQCHKK